MYSAQDPQPILTKLVIFSTDFNVSLKYQITQKSVQ